MIKFTIKKNTLKLLIVIILYQIILNLSYYFVVSQVWDYYGFLLKLNWMKLIESYALLFLIVVMMPKSTKKVSSVLLWLLLILSYIPMLTVYAMKDESRIYMYAVTGFWLLTLFLSRAALNIIIPSIKKSQAKIIQYSIFIFLSTLAVVLIKIYSGISLNFDLNKVYEIRSGYVSLGIPFSGYLFNWVAIIANPFFMVFFLSKRKWAYAATVFVVQLILFSATGNRIYLFCIPFVLLFVYSLKFKNPAVFVSVIFSIMVFLGIISYVLFGDIWISSLFANRTLFDPAVVSFDYYDYFSKNGFIYLSSTSIFNLFVNYPFDLDPPHLIGEVYYGNPSANVNSGIVADAYMNFGLFGFVLWSILLSSLLKLVDSLSKNKDTRLCVAVLGMMPILFTNTSFFTSFATNGLAIGLILLYLIPQKADKGSI